ncbi:MAG: polysaccharide deacetylase family protein [Hyphomicrobiaceae bacterium]|nr:polysaccharide deacetylase family protein [Hyphomicrobiaceae bacterium]
MSRTNTRVLKAALTALAATGADRLGRPYASGAGAILMLHHVEPGTQPEFSPNGILKVTPEFLAAVVDDVLACGYDVIALDDVEARLAQGPSARPFACFTFDDGYRDNLVHAYPVFKARNLPFAIYVPGSFPDGDGDLWWLVLEEALRRVDEVVARIDGIEHRFPARTTAEKYRAHHAVYWWLRTLPEDEARAEVAGLARFAGYDPSGLCRELVMTWDELRALAADPLVTIGAHTVGHYALAKLPRARMQDEIAGGIARLEAMLGKPCRHMSYPYGSESAAGDREFAAVREMGLATGVTTRKGLIKSAHADRLTALPRLSLNGDFQSVGYVRTLLSGVPFALMEAADRVRAASARLRRPVSPEPVPVPAPSRWGPTSSGR